MDDIADIHKLFQLQIPSEYTAPTEISGDEIARLNSYLCIAQELKEAWTEFLQLATENNIPIPQGKETWISLKLAKLDRLQYSSRGVPTADHSVQRIYPTSPSTS